MDFIVGLPTT
jgi:transposase InsO family protein